MLIVRPIAVLTAILVPLVAAAQPPAVFPPYTKPTLIAHRGASAYAPEHTIEAYRLALEQAADFVEPDLQITKDGVLVCLHDYSLERTTDVSRVFPDRARLVDGKKTWLVSDFTLEEIQKLDAGSWFAERCRGARVPTFQAMIDLVKGKAGILPEIKNPEVYARLGVSMEKLLLEALRKNGLDRPGADRTPVVLQSFHAETLKSLRTDHGCKLPLIYLLRHDVAGKTRTSKEGLETIKRFADGIGPNRDLVLARPELVADAHALGLSVSVWTFRKAPGDRVMNLGAQMRYFLRDLKVDAVFTDNPDHFPRAE